jgi:hypothetical protein
MTLYIFYGEEKMLERTFSKPYSVQSQINSGNIDKVTRKFTAPNEKIYLKNATFVQRNKGEFYSERKCNTH